MLELKWLEDIIACCVCMEQYKDPKILPCGHSFCSTCLESWFIRDPNGFSHCPLCRTEVNVGYCKSAEWGLKMWVKWFCNGGKRLPDSPCLKWLQKMLDKVK